MTSAAIGTPVASLFPIRSMGRVRGVRLTVATGGDDDGDEWVTGDVAAEIAGVDPATIWRLGRDGVIERQAQTGGPNRSGPIRYRRSDLSKIRRRNKRADARIDRLEERLAEHDDRIAELERWRQQPPAE